eukprot:1846506-Rhodomonas_salina.1
MECLQPGSQSRSSVGVCTARVHCSLSWSLVGEDALSWRLALSALAGAPESLIDEVFHVDAGLREALREEEGPD